MQSPLSLGTCLQNRYQLIRILGQGGFGRTYLAEDQGRFKERCAIKEWIPPQTTAEDFDKSRELFQREATILYQVEHPQIPQFHAIFEQDHRLFLVQDYVEGATYRELLDQRQGQGQVFAESEVRTLLEQLLPVLSYLHHRGIIHRDISPDNIILRSQDQRPVLIDFGVVKEVVTQLQASGTVVAATTVGKLGYAPSEQMQTGRAYPNSDLYALAVTAIVLLTGREPQDLFDDHTMTWQWQSLTKVRPSFAHLINRMLSFRPSDRYASAEEVLQVLGAIPTGDSMADVSPSISTLKTVAIGGRQPQPGSVAPRLSQPLVPKPREQETQRLNPDAPRRVLNSPAIAVQSSPWSNPWILLPTGVLVALASGIGAWILVNALLQGGSSPSGSNSTIASPQPTLDPTAPLLSPKAAVPQSVQRRPLALPLEELVNREGSVTVPLIYDFAAEAGQVLTLDLKGQAVHMTLLGPNQEPVSSETISVTHWSGVLPTTGTYALRLSLTGDARESDYQLQASLSLPAIPTPTPTIEDTPTPDASTAPAQSPEVTPTPTLSPESKAEPKPKPNTVKSPQRSSTTPVPQPEPVETVEPEMLTPQTTPIPALEPLESGQNPAPDSSESESGKSSKP